MRLPFASLIAAAAFASATLFAPAVLAEDQLNDDWSYVSEEDPWEKWNRRSFAFNDVMDRWAVRPVAVGYQKITPQPVRRSVRNFFGNLGEGKNLINNLLQAKFHDAGVDTARFMFNTTFGVFGLFDVATKMGLQRNDEDFGQTLGKWGVQSGPYLVVPFLGPSTVRDAPSLVPDFYTSVYPYAKKARARDSMAVIDIIQRRENVLKAEDLLGTDNKYVLVRNAWLQNREFRVRDGEVEDDF